MPERAGWWPLRVDTGLVEVIEALNRWVGRMADIVGALQIARVRTVTTNGRVTAADRVILVDTTDGNVTITLPLAKEHTGQPFTLVKIAAANTLDLDTLSSDTLVPAVSITAEHEAVTVMAVGRTEWMVIGR